MPTFKLTSTDGTEYTLVLEPVAVTPPAPPAPPPPPPPPPSGVIHGWDLPRSVVGVRPGIVLTPSGGFTVTKAGTVVENLDFSGQLTIDAPNVTVRNCRWKNVNLGQHGGALIKISQSEYADILVEHCEGIDGNFTDFISGSQYTARFNFISGSNGDAFRIGSQGHCAIESNWAENFVNKDAHSDFVQCYMNHSEPYPPSTHGNIIRGNCVVMTPYGDAWTFHVESSLIESNYFAGGSDIDIGIRQDDKPEMIIRDNVFDCDAPLAEKGTRYVWENNRRADTGEVIPRPQ